MSLLKRAVIFLFLIGLIRCQSINDIDVNEVKDKFAKNFPEISSIQDFNETNIPNAEDVEKVLREKCEKHGAADAVERLKEEQQNTIECFESYVNMSVIQEELEDAKATGSMDEVFSKYCSKWPEIKKCFDNATSIARECLDSREEVGMNEALEILNELQEFMCFKNGDRLAMFVAEKGPECLQEQKDGIEKCFNKTFGSRIPDTNDISVTNLPVFLLNENDCKDFDIVRECVNTELEKCKTSTPANIIEALFKFLKKHLPCNNLQSQNLNQPNNSWSFTISTSVLIASFLYVRFF